MKAFSVFVLISLVDVIAGRTHVHIPNGCAVFNFLLNGFHGIPLPTLHSPFPLHTKGPPLFGKRFIINKPIHIDAAHLNFSGFHFGGINIDFNKVFNVSTQLVLDSVKPTLPVSKEISHTCRIGLNTTSQNKIAFVKAMMKHYKICTLCDEFDTNTTTCETVGFCPMNSVCYRGNSDDRKYWPKSSVYNIFDAMHPKAGFHGCCLPTDKNCKYHRYVVKNKNNHDLKAANYTIHTCTSSIACNGDDRHAVANFVSKLTKVDGHWGSWGRWSHCSATCGSGSKTRARTCTHPKPSGGGRNCVGSSTSATPCTTAACPVDGHWGAWQTWGTCSVTCGDGKETRSRTCSNPQPAYGGKQCSGDATQDRHCGKPCIINGHWATWGRWSHCSTTCGSGTKTRARTCTHPKPSGGGKSCAGSSTSSTHCTTSACPVDGHWHQWQSWGSCSVTCGHGTKSRVRTCSSVLYGGKPCSGSSRASTTCGSPCAIDGQWGAWHAWGRCTVTCGDGKETRSRACSNPQPAYGGKPCAGDASQNRHCGTPCIINGQWTKWQEWSKCSKSCASGTRSRARTCTNPAPANGGTDCTGDTSATESCNTDPCPHWSRWFYDACSVSCGNGTTMRLRHCSSGKDADCGIGKAFENVACSEKPCPIDGSWGGWNVWTKCTVTCGEGKHTRTRLCNHPSPQHGGAACSGPSDDTAVCNTHECPHWLPFKEQGSCSVTCGKGFIQLKRICSTGIPSDCTGSAYNEKSCVLDECV